MSPKYNIIVKTSPVLLVIMALLSFGTGKKPAYKDPSLPVEKRVEDLLSKMTLEEKFWQLYMIPGDITLAKEKLKYGICGLQVRKTRQKPDMDASFYGYLPGEEAEIAARHINEIQRYFTEETRLGIPVIPFDEALHGLIRKGATAFPQSIALAATWDTLLMREVSNAIALETASRGIRQVLSPVVNIARDVRWGRVEETYGEDPFLTSQMAKVYTSAFENAGVITTPKHFVANAGDGGRDSYPVHFSERLLEEVYFPAFKSCIQRSGSQSIMAAYNSLDGRPCTANDWLLNKKLKQEWGFTGFVVSDAGAVGGANVLHFTSKDYAGSTKQALENGLDVILQTSYDHYPLFYEAFEKGMIDTAVINNAVRRVLKAKFKLGLFENPYVDPGDAAKYNGCEKHKKLALKAARNSIVLLKNEDKILPLSKVIRSITVAGEDAAKVRLGGYSGPGNSPVSILEGIRKKTKGKCTVIYKKGCSKISKDFTVIPAENLFYIENGEKISGVKGEYFTNTKLEGAPAIIRNDKKIDFNWSLYSPEKDIIDYDNYSVRWTGKVKTDTTGMFKIGIEGDDGYKMYLDGKLFIDNWKKQTFQTITKPFYFEKGKDYDIKIEFYETTGNVKFKLIWNCCVDNAWQKDIWEAVKSAEKTDATIVVAGIVEGEFQDRASLDLPGHQEELILELAKTGKPVIVILTGGSAITMQKWYNRVPAILDIWYPGEQGGNAVADILFGDVNPSGKLPVTFPVDVGQVPLYYNHKPTGRGDDYVDMTGKPMFPFGFGLSYTRFEYSDMTIRNPVIKAGDTTQISFKIKNTGDYDGAEIIQLYIRDMYASVVRPVMELKAFQKVFLKRGETKTVSFDITPDMLEMLDENMNRIIEPGKFKIMAGASSRDIRLKTILEIIE